MKPTIEYDNDTGPSDEGFEEWWIVTYGDRSFRCKREQDALWLAHKIESINPTTGEE